MKTKNRTSKILGAVAVLLCLVLVSSCFSSGMLARYVTRAGKDGDSRIAALRVSATTEEITSEAGPHTRTYTVTLRNDSEVAVLYEGAPALMLPEGADGVPAYTGDFDEELGVFTGTLAPHGSKTLTLTVDLSGISLAGLDEEPETAFSFSNDDISEITAELPFTVTVTFTQID